MCPRIMRPSSRRAQQGVGLPAALFIIVVLALIVLAMAELQEGGARSFTYQLLSTRAFYAAESGAQAAVHQLIPPGGASPGCGAGTFYSKDFTSASMGLGNCSVRVSCSLATAGGVDHYTLQSTGSCGDGIEKATRIIEVRVRE